MGIWHRYQAMLPVADAAENQERPLAVAEKPALAAPAGGAGLRLNFTLFLLLALFVIVLLRTAWLCDDAYITLRTVDNFRHGYGLRWNIAERVQSYTNPLWMFCQMLASLATGEVYYSTLGLSLLASLAAVLLLAWRVALAPAQGLLAMAILISSKAFMDYSTSGLENPLTHLLLAAFWALYFAGKDGRRPLFLLSLIAGLAAFNRMDTILFYLPALALLVYRQRSLKALGLILLGFTPFILWEVFAVIYYGFPFPNTAYAKLGVGQIVSHNRMIKQGLYYLVNALDLDPVTPLALGAGLALVMLEKRWRDLPLTLGALLYLGYVILIGGDFMSGRMLAAPLLAAAILTARSPLARGGVPVWLTLLLIFGIGLAGPLPSLLSRADYGLAAKHFINEKMISDERGFYYQATGLLKGRQDLELPASQNVLDGKALRKKGGRVLESFGVGFLGYYAGPDVFIVDLYALCDPLLARMTPVYHSSWWRPGHSERISPEGYLATLQGGRNAIKDRNLAEFYDKLCLITRGPLFTRQRWAAVIGMNLGRYNHLLPTLPPGTKPF